MSSARAAHHTLHNHAKTKRNGFNHSKYNNRLSLPHNHKYNHKYNQYQEDDDNDTDTLESMESQSPSNATNNTAIRHRLRSPNIHNNRKSSIYKNIKRNTHKYYARPWKKQKIITNNNKNSKNSKFSIKIILSLTLFLCSFLIYYFYGDYLTFTSLRNHHHLFIKFIDKYPVISPIIYVISVIIVVGLTIPGATVLSMAAGLFFSQPFASIYAWMGCGGGAICCFFFVRFICEDCFKSMIIKHGDWFTGFENGLKKNELLYLIYVRYIILIPFWFVNVAAALLGAKWKNFIISTFIATIPGSLLYTTAGRGLAKAFDVYTDDITIFLLLKQVFFSKDIQYCLLLLLCCLCIPFILKKYKIKYFDLDGNDSNQKKRNNKYKNNDFIDSSDDNSDDIVRSNKDKYL